MTKTPSHRHTAPAPRSAARADDPKPAPSAAKVLASDPEPAAPPAAARSTRPAPKPSAQKGD